MDVTPRLTRWIVAQFDAPTAEQVLTTLRELPPVMIGRQDVERIQSALALRSGGDMQEFQSLDEQLGAPD
jgi:hypothetical protein